jgi:DNA-directed RNA polymerase specialized sigma24 family protein
VRDLTTQDPAEVVLAWEAVEELLAAVPESPAKDVLRMVAAGLPADEIAERLGLGVAEVDVLAARGRIRVLTAAIGSGQDSRTVR